MIISHSQLVCPHVSDKQVTWEAIDNWNDLGLLATRALHAMFSQMPFLVPFILHLLVGLQPVGVIQQAYVIQAPAPAI